ncbi:MAG: hypothetical protein GF399_12175 [Candidatus Coatesbacteria bacterium]|nr:hypothetical protein [Candidatus Coatesbacteria bacterium]
MRKTTNKQGYFIALLHLLRKTDPLPFNQTPDGWTLEPGALPAEAGVYCLWWTGGNEHWQRPVDFELQLVRREDDEAVLRRYCVNRDLFDVDHHFPVPLFIGKTRNLARRVERQLMLDTARIPGILLGLRGMEKQISHFRSVFDQYFPDENDVLGIITEHLAYSHVKLEGRKNAFWRFFFTAYAIGVMRPICNIDVIDNAAASLADNEFAFDRAPAGA